MHLAGEGSYKRRAQRDSLCMAACRGSIIKYDLKCQQAEPTRLGSTQISGKIPTEWTKSSSSKHLGEHSALEVQTSFQGIHLDLGSLDLTMSRAAFSNHS